MGSQIPDSELIAEVEVNAIREPTLRMTRGNFRFEQGKIYRGMTATLIADVAPYRFDGIHTLTDASWLYETSDPRMKGSKWFLLLKEKGFYYLGGCSDISVAVDPAYPSFLPLPLHVGMKLDRTTRYFVISPMLDKEKKTVGEILSARFIRLEGKVLGEYHVEVRDEEHECLLLRDHITGLVTKWYADGEQEKYSYSVLLDRYIREDGLLHLEHIWHCKEGGEKSSSEAEARAQAKALFKKTYHADKEWYRVHGHVMKKDRWMRYP